MIARERPPFTISMIDSVSVSDFGESDRSRLHVCTKREPFLSACFAETAIDSYLALSKSKRLEPIEPGSLVELDMNRTLRLQM